MSAALDKILEEVRTLTPDEQQQLREMLEREARTAELRRIQEKYTRMNVGSEDFAAGKAKEIALEDRRR
jgi:hypothetical protein